MKNTPRKKTLWGMRDRGTTPKEDIIDQIEFEVTFPPRKEGYLKKHNDLQQCDKL